MVSTNEKAHTTRFSASPSPSIAPILSLFRPSLSNRRIVDLGQTVIQIAGLFSASRGPEPIQLIICIWAAPILAWLQHGPMFSPNSFEHYHPTRGNIQSFHKFPGLTVLHLDFLTGQSDSLHIYIHGQPQMRRCGVETIIHTETY